MFRGKQYTYNKNTYRILKTVDSENTQLVLKIAHTLKITYYDSSYLVTSYELDADLITDDKKLRRRIGEKGRPNHPHG